MIEIVDLTVDVDDEHVTHFQIGSSSCANAPMRPLSIGYVRVCGDDAAVLLENDVASSPSKTSDLTLFCDPRFPAIAESIDGSARRNKRKRNDERLPNAGAVSQH